MRPTFSTSLCMRAALVLLCPAVVAGCVHPVRRDFAWRHECPTEKVVITEHRGGDFAVKGCGYRARYRCTSAGCSVASYNDNRVLRKATPPAQRQRKSAVSRTTHTEGHLLLGAKVALDGRRTTLRVLSAPAKHPNDLMLEVSSLHMSSAGLGEGCHLRAMLDGKLLTFRDTKQSLERGRDVVRVQATRGQFHRIATADHTVLRVCERRWELDADAVGQLRRYAVALHEELLMSGDGDTDARDTFEPPAAGWPSWSVPSEAGPTPETTQLTAEKVFEKLRPSVYTVHVENPMGEAGGSAVAVTPTRLITNCHVLEEASEVRLMGGGLELEASIVSADPNTDRCVLEISGGEVKPIDGVRPYADLHVGERAFTLGAPAGLEHSLAEGIVSGKRDGENASYVQTTAPISPGSSGGGLFDEEGNLIGITTFVYEGRERRNQSLNFAIAASAFWDENTAAAKVPDPEGEYDPDVTVSMPGIQLRIAAKADDGTGELTAMLRRPLNARGVSWEDVKVRLSYKERPHTGMPLEVHRRIDDKGKYEDLLFTVGYEDLRTWSQYRFPTVHFEMRGAFTLKGENLTAVRKALKRYQQLHPNVQTAAKPAADEGEAEE